jgi:hypothetical protein
MPKTTVRWQSNPGARDFDAALGYLGLIYPAADSRKLVRALRRAGSVQHTAKDLLRASGLPLLPRDEVHVAADLKRIRKDKALSPVLLIQGDMSQCIPLIVADGYHRICAVCHYDEDAAISCRLSFPEVFARSPRKRNAGSTDGRPRGRGAPTRPAPRARRAVRSAARR